jgi:hypothetical protein
LTVTSESAGTFAFTRDKIGNILTETQTINGLNPSIQLGRTYDLVGNRTQLFASIGGQLDFVNNYTYDGLDRITKITQSDQVGGNAVAHKQVNYTYNLLGQMTQVNRYQSLTTTGEPVLRSVYSYDSANRLTSVAHRNISSGGSATLLDDYNFTYDLMNRITAIDSHVDGISSFSYDKTSQIIAANHAGSRPDETYAYDANGNRNSSGYTTGANNQTTADGTYTYQYDKEGNRTRRSKGIQTGTGPVIDWRSATW